MESLFMKNNDYKFVQRIIEYCDIINDLVEEYGEDYIVFNQQNHSNYP